MSVVSDIMSCKICSAPVDNWAHAEVLHKYQVSYFMCSVCGFVNTERPYWLNEAYSEPIAPSDLGLVSRNLGLAVTADATIRLLFSQEKRFLDFGGGTGLFVRLMRDRGHDFFWSDEHTENTFATGFDVGDFAGQRFGLITAFEVFEHLEDPRPVLEKLLACTDSVLFTTGLLASPPPKPGEWWYYTLDTGQHISFFTKTSLHLLARDYGLHFYTSGGLHLLTKKRISRSLFWLASRGRIARLLNSLIGHRSLLAADYERMTGSNLGQPGQGKSRSAQ